MLFAGTLSLFPFLGTAFIPGMAEGTLSPNADRVRNISLDESLKREMAMQKIMMKVPGVESVVSRVGRGESPVDPAGPNEADVMASLVPYDERPRTLAKEKIAEEMREKLANIPGINLVMSQPISDRVDEMRFAALIITVLPFASIGGILGLYITGEYLSVPASVGFIALWGIAVLNGLVLVSYIRKLREDGYEQAQAVMEGARLRFRPVMMTATVAMLGLVPFLFATGPGSEIQKPLAVVVIGGLVSSTLLTLVLVPVVYSLFEGREKKETATDEPLAVMSR